jgi:glycerol uptake facilitator-like aquaporin
MTTKRDSDAGVVLSGSSSTDDVRERSPTNDFLYDEVQKTGLQEELAEKKIDKVVEAATRDKSPEAKAGRRRMVIRAAYGEFMCTLLFYAPIFFVLANGAVSHWSPEQTALSTAFVAGFQAVGVCFAFSSISGAQFNSAISFALWMTGKLSNRRAALYILVQFFASIIAMVLVSFMFQGDMQTIFKATAVIAPHNANLGKLFATEFFCTFFLTYVAFTVAFEDAENQKKESMSFKTISDSKGLVLYATTPQSRTGFAPFSIGFTIFSLALCGGSSGAAFNPGRIFGPAIFSGEWNYVYLYWLGEFLGAACAGLLVNNMHRFGLESVKKKEISAKEIIDKAMHKKELNGPSVSAVNGEADVSTTHNALHSGVDNKYSAV